VGPAGTVGDAICEALAGWTRAELLRPSYWISPQAFPDGELKAQRLDDHGSSTVMLPEDLGHTAWTTCRFVLVQPLSRAHPGEPGLATFAEQYASFVERTLLPLETALLRINLLVPTSDACDVRPDVLIDGWEQTVVASPEERASMNHVNVLVLEDRNLVGHSAVAAAAAAGLWVGMDGTPLEEVLPESGSGDALPRLMRTFVRAVRGGEVTREIAEVALTPRQGKWRLPTSETQTMTVSQDPRALIESTIENLEHVDGGSLEYGAAPAEVQAEKTKAGFGMLWRVFQEFWSMVLQRIKVIPARIVSAVEAGITKRVFGSDGAHEFGFDAEDLGDRAVQLIELGASDSRLEDGTIFGQARVATRALEILGQPRRPEAARAQAWVELRQICLGTVDGGPMPPGFAGRVAGSAREVITEPALLVPDSERERFAVPDDVCREDETLRQYAGLTLAPCDPLHSALLDNDMELVARRFADEASNAAAVAAAKDHETAILEQQAREARDADDPAAAEHFDRSAQACRVDAERARGHQEELQRRADRMAEVCHLLNAWAAPRLGTLMWRVGEFIGCNLDDATIEQRDAFAAITEPPHLDVEAIETARKRVVRSLTVWSLAAVVGAGVGVVVLGWRLAPLAAFIVLLLLTFGTFVRYSRVRSEVDWAFAMATAGQMNALTKLMHAAKEVSRLSALYALYVEWTEILGYQAHRPFVPDDASLAHTPLVELDPSVLPPALVVGSGRVSDEAKASLGAQAGRDIQTEGWLMDCYHDSRTFSMERLAYQEGRSADDLDPDFDALTDSSGAREFLLDDLRNHRPQQAAYDQAMVVISEFCSTLSPDRLFSDVSVDGGGDEAISAFLTELVPGVAGQVPGFLVDVLTPDARVRRIHENPRPFVWMPPGVGRDAAVRHHPVATTKSGHYLLLAVRVDLSEAVTPGDFAMFRSSEAVELPEPVSNVGDLNY